MSNANTPAEPPSSLGDASMPSAYRRVPSALTAMAGWRRILAVVVGASHDPTVRPIADRMSVGDSRTAVSGTLRMLLWPVCRSYDMSV